MRNAILGNDLNKSNQWFSVVCTLLDNDTRHHSGQNPLNHIRFVFYHNIKHNEINFLSRFVKTNTDSKCTRCIMQNSYLYDTDFPFKNFCHLSQHAETIRKNAWEKSNDANSLSIRVQTTMNHISICCLAQYQRQRKWFFQSASWKRHCATHWREQHGMDFSMRLQDSQQLW